MATSWQGGEVEVEEGCMVIMRAWGQPLAKTSRCQNDRLIMCTLNTRLHFVALALEKIEIDAKHNGKNGEPSKK